MNQKQTMFQKKLMHPRNIYNKPPDFKNLAADFPDFRKFVQIGLSGQAHFNFKNPDAVRAFSRVLLQRDFNLDVTIPPDTLIPTVPLRLNYVLWMEDLLSLRDSQENTRGIDIGTGASCVYPLIIARKNQWKMIATEKDSTNLNCARGNVERNDLTDLITVKQVTGTTLLEEVLSGDPEQYDFCMCNPPFFSDIHEMNPSYKARKEDRNPPRNAFSCAPIEVVTEGGEVEFITKLIQESVTYKDRIKIFSSMVGIKRSLKRLKELLSSTEGVASFKQTEFVQGRTTRWGLAWTFTEMNLSQSPDYICDHKKQLPKMFSHAFAPSDITISEAAEKLKNIFTILQIKYTVMKTSDSSVVYNISAASNTWSYNRRKKREQKRLELKSQAYLSDLETRQETAGKPESAGTPKKTKRELEQSESEEENETKRLKLEYKNEQKEKYLEATVHIKLEDKSVIVQLVWVAGSAGKDTLHQILQYIINHSEI